MTRETKVGLLIGTLILLLVGIVVSDHLAVKQEQDRLNSNEFGGIQPRSVPDLENAGDNSGLTLPSAAANVTGQSGPGRVIPTHSELAGDQNLGSLVTPSGQGAGQNGEGDTTNPDGRLAINDRNNTGEGHDDIDNARALSDIERFLQGRHGRAIESGNSDNTRIRPVIHYVKEGETLWAIAQQYYDDGSKWNVIAKHNKDRLLAGNHVRKGLRLEIPNRVVEGGLAANDPNGTNTGAGTGDRVGHASGRTVTVKAGDNLTRLAKDHLGSASHVNLLLKANKDKIRNANQIRIGMVLRLPAVPSPASTGTGNSSDRTSPPETTRGTASDNTRVTQLPRVETPLARAPRTYVVQEGDTLTAVAADALGNPNRWKEIWTLNKSRIPNPNVLSEGLALKLPDRQR